MGAMMRKNGEARSGLIAAGLTFLATLTTSVMATDIAADDSARIRAKTEAYFALLDVGDIKPAYRLYRESFRRETSLDAFARSFQSRLPTGDEVVARALFATRWIDDDGAPNGRYAVVDYQSALRGGGEICGSVVWVDGATPELIRHETKRVPARFTKWATRDEINTAFATMGCRTLLRP